MRDIIISISLLAMHKQRSPSIVVVAVKEDVGTVSSPLSILCCKCFSALRPVVIRKHSAIEFTESYEQLHWAITITGVLLGKGVASSAILRC